MVPLVVSARITKPIPERRHWIGSQNWEVPVYLDPGTEMMLVWFLLPLSSPFLSISSFSGRLMPCGGLQQLSPSLQCSHSRFRGRKGHSFLQMLLPKSQEGLLLQPCHVLTPPLVTVVGGNSTEHVLLVSLVGGQYQLIRKKD